MRIVNLSGTVQRQKSLKHAQNAVVRRLPLALVVPRSQQYLESGGNVKIVRTNGKLVSLRKDYFHYIIYI